MSKPTFTVRENLVRIHIKGVPRKFPIVPDDKGIVGELCEAIHNDLLPGPYRTEVIGGGEYIALFDKDDVDQVCEWLKDKANAVHKHPERTE